MNKVKFTVLAIVAAFATTAAASDIEFHGYTRAAVGMSSAGGGGACFRLAGADTDYRLGNECDYVVEPNFEIIMAKLDDKSSWGFHFMPKAYGAWHEAGDSLALEAGQVYFFANNLPWLANGSIWAGRKYHDRLQLGINDQFLENEDSNGFGIENADLGFGKLSLSFGVQGNFWDNGDQATAGVDNTIYQRLYKIGASLTGIQTVNKDSSLQIWAGYYGQWRNKDLITALEKDPGFRIAVYHNLGMGSMGNLLVGAKYHKNDWTSGADAAASAKWNTEKKQWRAFAQWGVNLPSARTSLDVLAEYRDGQTNKAKDHDKWATAGFRTDTQLSGPFRFLLEAGYDWQKTGKADSTSLIKVTPVLAISAGNDPGSRPTFRLFYTYASWNKAGVIDNDYHGKGVNNVFAGKKSGGLFGVQAEGWW